MFGVALGINLSNFKEIIKKPKALILGLISQFVLLPAVTFLLIIILQPSEGVALGMILVASCPGGNISNFISSLAKANIELSVSLTGVSTLLSIFLTPINFAFWGSLYVSSSPLLQPIEIDFFQMFQTVILILGIPLIIGVLFSKKFTDLTKKIQKPIKIISIIIFAGFVGGALFNNLTLFIKYIHLIILIVFLHNALALLTGYLFARIFKLKQKDRKTISIETGIQNSGLALVLIFNPNIFPADLQIGGMAFIAAWWGIWHIISGMAISYFWGRKN
jgi:BASS family bile acid:Na+ symporter